MSVEPAAAWPSSHISMLVLAAIARGAAGVSVSHGSHIFAVATRSDDAAAFDRFVEQYGRGYSQGSSEYNERYALFRQSLAEVDALNAAAGGKFSAGINKFADQTEAERRRVLGYRRAARPGGAPPPAASLLQQSAASVPDEISYANLTTASWIMNQGSCGSCWAVAAAGLLDTHYELAYGARKRQFSPQELVSCVGNPRHCGGKGGCDGATVELAMEYAMRHGLSDLRHTPYEGVTGSCRRHSGEGAALSEGGGVSREGLKFGLRGWRKLGENSEVDLLRALMGGPVGVSVDGSHWFSYSSGVWPHCKKNSVVNHAVALFGYKAGPDSYWLIRNSWGRDWGEKGFIRLARSENEESNCGVDKDPQQGTGCDGGPSEVTVCGACGILYDNVVPDFVPKGELESLAAGAAGGSSVIASFGTEFLEKLVPSAAGWSQLVRREWRRDA